ncbi:MAG: Fic family protein [Chlamydiales bacterium]|nr:Fic family protein [Chlamydiales bacterium]
MKKPHIPPSLKDLERLFSKKNLANAIKLAIQTESEGKYRHWDTLRHLSPPNGLSHEEWWLATKFHRLSLRKSIPLLDTGGEPFYYTIPESVTAQLHQIDRGVGRDSDVPYAIENPHTRKTYLIRSLVEEAITSSQLEGAATTRKVAKEMLRSGRKPRNKSEQMIFNNFSAMQKLREWKDFPLTIDLIFDIHRTVTKETLEQTSYIGAFRKESDHVVIEDIATQDVLHEPPKADELEKRMEALCSFVNEKTPCHFIHPIVRAMIAHFWLAYDHPFVDGNGRTARTLFYYMMLRAGYWLFEYISISEIILKGPAKYGKAFLYTETDDNDLTYFILHQSEVIQKAYNILETLIIEQEEKLYTLDECEMGEWNFRQQALLLHALANKGMTYTIEGHRQSHDVAYETARNDLLELYEANLFSMQKKGKAFVFKFIGHK